MSAVISALGLIALLSIGAAVPARSIEGRPAPQIEGRRHIGPRVPAVGELKGKVVLLFFWAHWCSDCKAEGPIVARLLEKYRSRGLAIIAPTQEFGYVEGGRPAPPDKELRHIIQVRDTYYQFLRNEPVPISEVNIRQYGVDSVPTLVLLDREGIARLFHPGRMTEEALEAAILELL